MNSSWPLTNLSSFSHCEFLNFRSCLSPKFSCMPFINSTSSAITGCNPNWRDNLCPTKIRGQLSDWLTLTKESSRVQPCLQGRSTNSFPEQRLVIEPNFQVASHFLMWPVYQPVPILHAVIQGIKVGEVSGSRVCQRSLKTLNNNSILRERALWLFAAE